MSPNTHFDYSEFTTRNLGFVTLDEQATLKAATVFVPGTGGMGGACLQSLVRAGIGTFLISDMDSFEVSNLNRQVFATLDTVGTPKVEATRRAILGINPGASVEIVPPDWPDRLDALLPRVAVAVNGTDDVAATQRLYRAARTHGVSVVNAYAAALPSVYVTRPGDPTPEERLDYPTRGKAPGDWTQDDMDGAFLRELEFVMGCSSSRHYIDLELAGEMAAGTRSRMSFAPMVILTGNMMAYAAIDTVLDRKPSADCRGYFFNPHTGRTERPPIAPLERLQRLVARRAIAKLIGER